MPLDTSIPLQVKPIQLTSPQELYQAEQMIQQNKLQQALGNMQLQNAQRAQEKQNRLQQVLSQSYGKPEELEEALLRSGNLDESLKLGKDRRDNRKTDAEIGEKEFKTAYDKSKAFLDIASSATDQASYSLGLDTLRGMGVDVSKAPQQFDPNVVKAFAQQALTQKERLEAAAKTRGLDLQASAQAETRRHNKATEGNAAARLEYDKAQPKGQYDSERGLLIDPRTGEARQVTQGGQPIGAKDKALTDAQSKAALFGTRMQEANKILGKLSDVGVNVSVPGSRTPGIGPAINAMSPESQQMLDQAKRDFINATLRRESGAVISDAEFDNAEKQYFPQVGESKAVRAQKARAREIAIRGVQAEVPSNKREVIEEIAGKTANAQHGRKVVRTGTANGRRVVQYDDGSLEYAD